MRYVAFLRGINVGGNKKVPMAELKACLEKSGFKNVKTLLNSGNVAFDADKVTEADVEKPIEQTFGFPVGVLIRSQDSLTKLVDDDPFKNIDAKSYYVTFLKTDSPIKIEDAPTTNSKILKVEDKAAFWYVLPTAPNGATLDVMTYLDKTIGKDVTTRNWNTVVKSAAL